jgi:hypothetical protein
VTEGKSASRTGALHDASRFRKRHEIPKVLDCGSPSAAVVSLAMRTIRTSNPAFRPYLLALLELSAKNALCSSSESAQQDAHLPRLLQTIFCE